MQVADTSFLYALFSSTDQFHARAIGAVGSADSILIPSEIFSEAVSLIQYRQGFAAAEAAGEWIHQQAGIKVAVPSRALLERSWTIFLKGRGRLSYPDAVVVAWCRERNTVPLAFDEALLRRARARSFPRDRQRS